jgi:hypothetical protein
VNGPKYLNVKNMAVLLEKLYKGDLDVLFEELYVNEYEKEPAYKKYLNIEDAKVNLRLKHNKNIIFNFVFLIKDLDSLLNNLKHLNVNEGPQKDRGKCNFLNSNLIHIDNAFRNSMYLHSNLICKSILTPSHFDFKNIHMNLGNVRW